ncbi:DUF4232 domain-containing protein [Streptomyces roseochromogenus]|uniref:DUF4232 domain-containing protein n=1 Tax=Streptomyces roseochromogenus subsp. oscitans DS 12.976 TaxID=1352936 RepID=V6JI90_STRRC|nr:DUF4232 domain-containing protein [Streptomyces roseochromogenus]EST19612.1 hypothetical protein M878_41825 [Streptomyces roseochromogenus subsp. oscitans DS 12.976]
MFAVATAAGLGLAGAGVAQAAQAGAVTATPTCAVSALSASFGQGLAGGMNHQGVVLKLTNTGAHMCVLRGFPGLGLENGSHRTLHSATHWGDTWYVKSPAKTTLTLRKGQSAEAVIAWTHANTGTADAVHAAYLQVTPPAATSHKTLKFPQWVDNGDLEVTALAYRIDVTP